METHTTSHTDHSFDYHPRTRLVFGVGSVDRLPEFVHELGGKRVLFVTDPGIVAAGLTESVLENLTSSGLKVFVFDRVRENPTTEDVDACLEVARSADVDCIVGFGGGSGMDCAKGCNFILTNGGEMKDYWGVGKATKPMLPMIAVPTTAGTGSETQSFALISDPVTHAKMACGDPKASPAVSILDPALTLTQPATVAACSGIDALSHAVETAVTSKRTPLSAMFSREAFRLCHAGLERVFANPDDLAARGDVQLGAAYAGAAIENSMLGAAHAAANPLTANYGVTHGKAVGVMLPAVVRLNGRTPATADQYKALCLSAEIIAPETPAAAAADILASRLEHLLELSGLPGSLAKLGVPEADFEALSSQAASQWTAGFNPIPVTEEDFVRLYASAYRSGPRAS